MRLLFLNHNVAWSGTFLRAFHLGRKLVARGHQVTVVTTHRTARWAVREQERDGVTLVEAPDLLWGRARTGWDPWNAARRILHLHGRRFDLVHAFDCRPAVILPALALRRRGGLFLTDWADWWGRGGTITDRSGWLVRTFFGPVETWFEEAFRRGAAGTTVISTALADRAARLGVPRDRIFLLRQGCDVEGIVPRERERARAELGIAPGTKLVVHLGAIYRGDARLLFDALSIAASSGCRVELAMVGKPGAPLPPGAVCRRVGYVPYDTLQAWLAAADTCVVPLLDTVANRGRWPSKINDCLAAGRPVVITDVGDAASVVREHGAGWVTDVNPEAFARGLQQACSDAAACRCAGERARALAERVLAWPVVAGALEAYYTSLAQGRGGAGVAPAL